MNSIQSGNGGTKIRLKEELDERVQGESKVKFRSSLKSWSSIKSSKVTKSFLITALVRSVVVIG